MADRTDALTTGSLYIDAHVHLHDPANALGDLRQAAAGFMAAGTHGQPAVAMLAERAGFDVFGLLASQLKAGDEEEVLWFQHESQHLMLVAGRQIVTAEGIEVLGLGTRAQLPDGLPLGDVLASLDNTDALTVLPWAVGKWLGRRGRLIDHCLSQARPDRVFLGDNGGRPAWWTVPRFDSGFKVLCGSDPLPLPGSAARVGRFGTRIEFILPQQKPLQALKRALRDPAAKLTRYGDLASSARFLWDQGRLRVARKSHPGPLTEQIA
jgi:hypothetical protein